MAIAAYLLGSIPTGYLVGRAKGIDIRKVGSGNIGATNVFRILGTVPGSVALIVDGLKGFAACAWVADLIISHYSVPVTQQEYLRILAGLAAVLGHNFTCWLHFKGGKGVATGAGVFFALAPLPAGIALVTWTVFLAISRYVSVASIAGATALPAAIWVFPNSLTLRIVATVIGLLIIVKHQGNIKRLMNGTERQFGRKPGTPEVSK